MTAIVPAGSVIIGPADVPLIAWALRDTIARRNLAGRPVPARLIELAAVLGASATGNGSSGGPPEPATITGVTTKIAAERLGVTDRRVRQLVAAGDLPADRAGAVLLVDAAAVDALAAHRTQEQPADA